jgi:hypothetical protein
LPLSLQLLVYGVSCAVLLTWATQDSRLLWRIALALVTLTVGYAVLESPLAWWVAAWSVPSTSCVLDVDSRMLPLAILAQAPTVLFLTRFKGGVVGRVVLGGGWELWCSGMA